MQVSGNIIDAYKWLIEKYEEGADFHLQFPVVEHTRRRLYQV